MGGGSGDGKEGEIESSGGHVGTIEEDEDEEDERRGSRGGNDVDIIRNVLAVQHVPVVGSLAWDKLQHLLHSLSDRITSQSARLEKAEEQAKVIASLKDELNTLSQNVEATANEAKDTHAQDLAHFMELMEARFNAIDEIVEPMRNRKTSSELNDILERLAAMENGHKETNSHARKLEGQLKQIDNHIQQMDHDLQELDSEFTNKESQGRGMDTSDLTKRMNLLEAQMKEFQELMNQVTKAHTADLEAIQKTQRIWRPNHCTHMVKAVATMRVLMNCKKD
uniref:Uncharacterized protein n=1 Tax=Physcomitrium patens TaxID=3218 RepID=A0A2K1LAX4_PHYPA|nr:hypothetical protein PHYPA_001603 [Physcomitrium patens]